MPGTGRFCSERTRSSASFRIQIVECRGAALSPQGLGSPRARTGDRPRRQDAPWERGTRPSQRRTGSGRSHSQRPGCVKAGRGCEADRGRGRGPWWASAACRDPEGPRSSAEGLGKGPGGLGCRVLLDSRSSPFVQWLLRKGAHQHLSPAQPRAGGRQPGVLEKDARPRGQPSEKEHGIIPRR